MPADGGPQRARPAGADLGYNRAVTLQEQLAELAALGIAEPSAGPGSSIVLSPDQLERVLAASRHHRLEANALRRVVTDIDRGPQPPRYKPAELRQVIKTLEHRLVYLTRETAARKAVGEDRGPLPREHLATTVALARLNADLAACTPTSS